MIVFKTRGKRWILVLVLVILACLAGIYLVVFPPGASTKALKAELVQAQKKVESLREENDLKLDRINTLSEKLRSLEGKYRAERRGRIEIVTKKYSDIDADGTVDALNAITDRVRKRRVETVQSRGDPD